MKSWHAWAFLPRYFQDLCESSGVPCVNLTEAFKQAIRDGRLPYPLSDTHWSAEGHAIVAATLERVIKEHRWLTEDRNNMGTKGAAAVENSRPASSASPRSGVAP